MVELPRRIYLDVFVAGWGVREDPQNWKILRNFTI